MTQEQWEALVSHAREEAPNECCGYLRAAGDIVEEVVRARPPRPSPYGYELDSASILAANELDDEGYQVGIYHSHPRSPAEPSQTDINLAHYPHWTYLIVSLQDDDPVVRALRIADRQVTEEELLLDP